MRVAMVADKLDRNKGGSNLSLHVTAQELAERGHDVEVVLLNLIHPDNDPPEDRDYDVTERSLDIGGKWRAIFEVVRELRGLDCDVIHVWNPRIGPFAGAYRMLGGSTRVVVRLNAYFFCTNTSRMADGCWENCGARKKLDHDPSYGAASFRELPIYLFDTYATPFLMNQCDELLAQSPATGEVYESIGVDPERIRVTGSVA